MIIKILLLSLLSGFLYRQGGIKYKIIRRLGVSIVSVVALLAIGMSIPFWVWIVFVGIFYSALCTYCDRWGTSGVEWYEFALTGILYGLSAFPIILITGNWKGLLIRTLILAVFMPLSNLLQFKIFHDKTDGVEMSRGVVILATLPLLLIVI